MPAHDTKQSNQHLSQKILRKCNFTQKRNPKVTVLKQGMGVLTSEVTLGEVYEPVKY